MRSVNIKWILWVVVCLIYSSSALAQRMLYETNSDSTIFLKAVYNEDTKSNLELIIDGNVYGTIKAGGSLAVNRTCYTAIETKDSTGKKKLWHTGDKTNTPPSSTGNSVEINKIISVFIESLETDSFYSTSFLSSLNEEMQRHIDALKYVNDSKQREKYINEHQLNGYVSDKEFLISNYRANISSFISAYLQQKKLDKDFRGKEECINKMVSILQQKIQEREDVMNYLAKEINAESIKDTLSDWWNNSSLRYETIFTILIILIFIWIVVKYHKYKKSKRPTVIPGGNSSQSAGQGIVVRRKTMSILKTQSLEDVQGNSDYMQIDCIDFCNDSAVRRIYIKNTCIKEIYNMYADDLRNSENPNEDGCLVLGRWVHDAESDEYYVSLEEIVKPGDDAVFKEYELSFGGKIKLKVADRLRRLRRDTNLQYDMTCWVHSHPGLGVFFSNADNSVQLLLKHPTHPKFLVAIVVDILTPTQELGIFTFKRDMTVNSKSDLRKMYSLEEMYKWAVESDQGAFKAEDYINLIRTAETRKNSIYGVELCNSSIIDLCQIQIENQPNSIAWAHGYIYTKDGKDELIIKSVSRSKQIEENELLGCFITGAHCSIPSIRKMIADHINQLKFVLFYSTIEGTLTTMPIENNQLSTEEKCYGEEKLEDLKIWTRRKR
jgi:hypothetical protein